MPGNAASKGTTCVLDGVVRSDEYDSAPTFREMQGRRIGWVLTRKELPTRLDLGMDLDAYDKLPTWPPRVFLGGPYSMCMANPVITACQEACSAISQHKCWRRVVASETEARRVLCGRGV